MMSSIKGPNLTLRLIKPEDAEYVHSLRINPQYNAHLSAVDGTAEDQRIWIEKYKQKEAAGTEYYFIIERHDQMRCGTVRLYDIQSARFTWGSWILDENKTKKAALESVLLSFGFGFDTLEIDEAAIEARNQNVHAINFYRRFGARETHSDETDTFFVYTRTQFNADRARYMSILENEALDV